MHREESCKQVMLESNQDSREILAMVVKGGGGNQHQRKPGRLWCDFCRTGHSKETWWKMHGKHMDLKPKSAPFREFKVNQATASEGEMELFQLFQTFMTENNR